MKTRPSSKCCTAPVREYAGEKKTVYVCCNCWEFCEIVFGTYGKTENNHECRAGKTCKQTVESCDLYCLHCGGCGFAGCCGIRAFLEKHVRGKTDCMYEAGYIAEIIALH